jgi:small subunit ribosomal protein S16
MALKIRLRRMGRKKAPTYRIVVAESSMPRDGRFVENLGHYNPRTEPLTLVVDRAKALAWIAKGATPTDTVNSLMRKAGVFKPEPAVAEGALETVKETAKTAKRATQRAAQAVVTAAANAASVAAAAATAAAEAAASAAAAAASAVADAAVDVKDAVVDAVTGGDEEAEAPAEEKPADAAAVEPAAE